MGIRYLKHEDFEEADELQIYAFLRSREEKRIAIDKKVWKNAIALGAFSANNILESSLLIHPLQVFLHGKVINMGGIGDVATYPEVRGQGNVRALFEKAIKIMREQKMLVSYLAPFSYSFYRKFGYELVFKEKEYEMKSEDFNSLSTEKMTIQRVAFDNEKDTLTALYNKRYEQSIGPVKREETSWIFKRRRHDNLHYALSLNKNGDPEGYLAYYFELGNENTFVIEELVALNGKAEKSLWRFVSGHTPQFSTFKYQSSGFNELTDLFNEPSFNQIWNPGMMARIVDIENFLKVYPFKAPSHNQTIWLEVVSDSIAEWNNGMYELKWSGDQLTVEKKANKLVNKKDVVSGDIQTWTQLLMGTRTAEQLHYEEKFLGEKENIDILQEVIRDKQPELYDHF